MDREICAWILEFLMRKSADQMLLKKLTRAFPPLNGFPRLHKTLFIHSIKTEILAGEVSEKILDCLEEIEQLDRSQNLEIPDSMKQAYCAVALECTVKYLLGNLNQIGYLDAVNRIWKGRIRNLKVSNSSNLISEELRRCRRQVKDAITDKDVANTLTTTNTLNNAILSVNVYIREAFALMGPPLIERECASRFGELYEPGGIHFPE